MKKSHCCNSGKKIKINKCGQFINVKNIECILSFKVKFINFEGGLQTRRQKYFKTNLQFKNNNGSEDD